MKEKENQLELDQDGRTEEEFLARYDVDDYNKKVIKRKRISLADTILIGINKRAIENIANEGEYLYKSVSDLVLYATGAAACSTADLLVVLESINTSLDNIEEHLNKSYFESWRYIQVRIGYWKEKVYRTKSKQQILEDAFGRWRVAGKLRRHSGGRQGHQRSPGRCRRAGGGRYRSGGACSGSTSGIT